MAKPLPVGPPNGPGDPRPACRMINWKLLLEWRRCVTGRALPYASLAAESLEWLADSKWPRSHYEC
jgi:hypothetical protein